MDLVFVNQGLEYWLQNGLSAAISLGLFTAPVTVNPALLLSALTIAAWAGYTSANLAPGTWVYSQPGNTALAVYPAQTFLNTGGTPQTAYGYYYYNTANTLLLAVAQYATPQVLPATIGSLVVLPVIGDQSVLLV